MNDKSGTFLYMSPQRLSKNPNYKINCDVWSLGIILYFMLAGTEPF